MNNDLSQYTKQDTKIMLDQLGRELGADPMEAIYTLYPDFRDTSPEWKETVLQCVHNIMKVTGAPITVENARHAANYFLANAECEQAAANELQPPQAPAFVPKSADVEKDFFENATAEQLKDYFLQKYPNG
jgi:hypothetical protein